MDESFSAETLLLKILLLQIENHASYGLSLGEGHPKESRNALSTTSKVDLFKSIVICGY